MSDFVVVSMKINGRAENIDTFVSYLKNNAWLYDHTGRYCGLAKKHFSSISSEMEVNEERTYEDGSATSLVSSPEIPTKTIKPRSIFPTTCSSTVTDASVTLCITNFITLLT